MQSRVRGQSLRPFGGVSCTYSIQNRIGLRETNNSQHRKQSHFLEGRLPAPVCIRRAKCAVRASEDDTPSSSKESVEFGYTRKDVILIGAGLIGAGYALYYGAQAFGVEATTAGNYVQLFIFLVICVGYISTYIFRVANKDMTYAKQLEAYEERVMQKRLEEMPETERQRLMEEVKQEGTQKKGGSN